MRGVSLDKPFIAEFKRHRKRRTLSQNRLLCLWLRCIMAETGNDFDTLKEYFSKYLPWDEVDMFGKIVVVRKGTSDLNTKEFDTYLEYIRIEMLDEGIILPLPEDQAWDEFNIKYEVYDGEN